jgi:AbrB family looped-hinge helix DNA binding protein
MSVVTIKKKYQVVIPQRVRQQIGVRVGDLLEAQAYKGKIVFTPKSMVDRALAEGLDDLKKAASTGPLPVPPKCWPLSKARVGNPSGELRATFDEVAPNRSLPGFSPGFFLT